MDQHGIAERHRRAVTKGPFAAIAILGANIAVQIKAPLARGTIGAGAVNRVKVPERKITGFEHEVDEARGIETATLEPFVRHLLIEYRPCAGDFDLTHAVRAG